ncbi:MAG TPA: PRC and DUF2382 domain-containing protein [Acidimicrobiales bacterium]|nr:PRC and DUF2382 domain-containing protein [Acidimicrobiales bacterium]
MTMTDLSSWKGHDVVDPTGETIGRIEDIYLDEQTNQPEWLAVRTGLFGRRVSFVPLAEAQPSGDAVVVPYAKEQVKDAPHADPDGLLSEQEEAALYDHYGLPYSDAHSETGLSTPGTATATETSTGTTDDAMTRSEEELRVGTRRREAGRARLRKWVETEQVSTTVPVAREEVRIEREPIHEGNVDQALRGPEISEGVHEVALMEEEAVAATETVPKERIRLEKDTVLEEEQVAGEVRKERVEAEFDPQTGR